MWHDIKQLKDAAERWLQTEEQEARQRGATGQAFSLLAAKPGKAAPVSYFTLLGAHVRELRPAFASVLPEEVQFAILTALAIAGPQHLWDQARLPQLIAQTKAMALDLKHYYQLDGYTRSREDAALDFAVAWLLQDVRQHSRAYQLVLIDVLGTVELVLKWLNAEVPHFESSAGDAGTLVGALLDLLFEWPYAPCHCCLTAVRKLQARAEDGPGRAFDVDFQNGALPQALFYRLHEQRSNEEKRVINCFMFHRFRAYLKLYQLSRLALAQFLRQGIRGSYADISGAFLKAGMLYPLLSEKYNLNEENVAARKCGHCTGTKKASVKKWHDTNCTGGKGVSRCENCGKKYLNASVYSWHLDRCHCCSRAFEVNQRIESIEKHIIITPDGGFKDFETWTCVNPDCCTLFKAERCRPSQHKDTRCQAPHDTCPHCGALHRAAGAEESRRSFRTSKVYWWEEGATQVEVVPEPVRKLATAAEAMGFPKWAVELILAIGSVTPDGKPHLDQIPPEGKVAPLLAKWKKEGYGPQSYDELCEQWYELILEMQDRLPRHDYEQMIKKDAQRSLGEQD